ncbi:Ktr system potassium uptake protein A [bioreactor metagenome]|uniref:Ktr system potassium uptake protein A n=1 Tax=bioreactor metagenome TaxID=1076179 RepID=A0A645FZW0_9ZZZZ
MADSRQYVVIGLGQFGTAVAETLLSMGYEVLGIDNNAEIVQNLSTKLTHVVQLDAGDPSALQRMGLVNYDVVFVTLRDLQASIICALNLKEMGCKYLVVKANSANHAKILEKIGVEKVVLPERDMGVRIAHSVASSSLLDYIDMSPEYSIAEIVAPEQFFGKRLRDLDLRNKYNLNIIAIHHEKTINVTPSADDRIWSGDVIVVVGSKKDIAKLEE